MMMAEVGCAGILVADTFCGPMEHFPDEGQLLAVASLPTKAGGCAANVAIDLARQGFRVDIAGCVGRDASAKVLLTCLDEHSIGCERITCSEAYPTSKTIILLIAGQDRRYIHSFGANSDFTVAHIDRDWLAGLKVFYLGGLFLMPSFRADEFLDLLTFCRDKGVVSVVDVVVPQDDDVSEQLRPLLGLIDYFLPNDDEAAGITGAADPMEQLRVFRDWGANTVIISRGEKGVVAASKGRFWQAGVFDIPEVVDPSGCGDAFCAGVVSGILRDLDLPDTLRLASALGASATRAIGTTDGVCSAAEAAQFLARNNLDIQTGEL